MRYKIYVYGNHVGVVEHHNGLWTFDVEALAALTRLGKLFDVINTLDHHLPTMPYTRIDMVELQRT